MAGNSKTIQVDIAGTGLTVYCIVCRDADGYLLDDATGSFGASPADPYLSLAEHSVMKGRYSVDEDRQVWDDGGYSFIFYQQSAASPAPVSDYVVGSGEIFIQGDTEITAKKFQSGVVVTDAENTASYFKTDLSEATNNFWKGAWVKMTSGNLSGQTRLISLYNGTSKFVTLTSTFTGIPAGGDTFVLVNE